MIIDQDPFSFSVGEPFDVGANEDMVILWSAQVPICGGWYTAVAEFDRSTARKSIVYADGRVEVISGAFDALKR